MRRVADNELGFQQLTLSRPAQAKTYLFINTEHLVVGCLVAEPIRQVGMRFLFFFLDGCLLSLHSVKVNKMPAEVVFVSQESREDVPCLPQAYRVLEQPDQQEDMTKHNFMERHRAWCCSTVPEQALCGISRIWVFSLARRKGIATRMMDIVRWDQTPLLTFCFNGVKSCFGR